MSPNFARTACLAIALAAFLPAIGRAQERIASWLDQIVQQWANIRSYVVRDGHLFLALMADGGIYELEPIAAPN